MLPLKDELPVRHFPFVNYSLIAINILVFIWQISLPDPEQAYKLALIPAHVVQGHSLNAYLYIFTSMFMHGGLAHIGGNMLYLWIFGDNVEDAMGHVRYLFFYLLGGFLASVAHILSNPTSIVPTVGASGAIAAVLGAYIVLFPRARVLTLVALGFFIRLTMIPAVIVLGLWFLLQLAQGFLSLGMAAGVGGVAFWAHIGGFVTGLLLARLLAQRSPRYNDIVNGRSF